MMVALEVARYRVPHWMFALAIFSSVFAVLRIAVGSRPGPLFDALVLGLAMVCAVVGFVMRRRRPDAAALANVA
jgi:hypothetical protein